MFLRRLKDVTKNRSFLSCIWDVLKTSQKGHLFWDVSERSLSYLSQWRSDWDFSETSHAGWYRCFPVNYAKFQRTPFLQKTSGRTLLSVLSLKLSQLSAQIFLNKLHRLLNLFWCIIIESRRLILCACVYICVFVSCHMRV